MSIFFKPLGYLTAFAASVGGAGCSPEVSGQPPDMVTAAQNESPTSLPRPPLKIPMPLDKAGYKVDVMFEVPPLPEGVTDSNCFVGLRVMFAPGTDEVFDALENHPVTVRILMFRLENGKEVKIPLFNSKRVSRVDEFPRRFEVFEIPDGKATAKMAYADHSGAPKGTPDASAIVLGFAAARDDSTPGMYRLQVETLEDIPDLSGITSFLVYEERMKR